MTSPSSSHTRTVDWDDRGRSMSTSETHRDELHLHKTNTAEPKKSIESNISSAHMMRGTRSKLGLKPSAPIAGEHDHDRMGLLWSRIRIAFREPFLEFWGTFILVLFGNGSVAQVMLSKGETSAPGGNGFGDYSSIAWGWGIGLMLGVYVAGDSGAFLNPAVTFAACLYRQMPWRRFPMYLLAQLLGGFAAAGVVYANYKDAIDYYEGYGVRTVTPSPTATAGIFSTYRQPFASIGTAFFEQFLASALLVFIIFALQDKSNNGIGKGDKWLPLGLFFLMYGIGACFGWQTGYAINMARDFAPRLMAYAVGYGSEVWSAGDYYFWIPIAAPFVGCTFGGFMYDTFIYTGESPMNTPWMGLKRILVPTVGWQAFKNRQQREKQNDMV